jgi:dihydrofolate reductase
MRKLVVFNSVTLDGFFTGANGDMSWAHKFDPEWNAFTAENAKGSAEFIFGRITYDMMAGWWPTPKAREMAPTVADAMNDSPKVVFSKSLGAATWNNTRLRKGDIAAEVRALKQEPGPDLLIMGSGTIVSQLTEAGLIDEFQVVVHPLVIGKGRTMFESITRNVPLKRTQARTFDNGCVVLWYQPVG